jgi:hypothetical protein
VKPTAPQGRLLKQWRGHTVEVSPTGLALDGRTVDSEPLTEHDAVRKGEDAHTHPALQFLPDGRLVYRNRVQAEVHPDYVTVHGPDGARWEADAPQHAPELEPADESELDSFDGLDLDDEDFDL